MGRAAASAMTSQLWTYALAIAKAVLAVAARAPTRSGVSRLCATRDSASSRRSPGLRWVRSSLWEAAIVYGRTWQHPPAERRRLFEDAKPLLKRALRSAAQLSGYSILVAAGLWISQLGGQHYDGLATESDFSQPTTASPPTDPKDNHRPAPEALWPSGRVAYVPSYLATPW